jgi:ribosomal protein S18 acetylase RimI-like enzyme
MLDRITIRLAIPEEAESLATFINDIYVNKDNDNPDINFRKKGSVRIPADKLTEQIKNPGFRLWFALNPEQEIIGAIALTITQDRLRTEFYRGHISLFSIHPSFRSAGLGSKMRKHLENEAKKLEVTQLFAEVVSLQGNLVEYYKKVGFFLTGTLEQFKNPNFINGEITLVHLSKKL